MENFNTDPKPGRLILPLVLIGMIATTYTFIQRVAENNDLEIISNEVVEEEDIVEDEIVEETPPVSDQLATEFLQNPYYLYSGIGNHPCTLFPSPSATVPSLDEL